MPSPNIQDFNQKFVTSPEFRAQIRQVESVPQLMAVLQAWECDLTSPELMKLAQDAYKTWLKRLQPSVQSFFKEVRSNRSLNQHIETCNSCEDVIALAEAYGFQLSKADLQAAATEAHKIEGFSFEKLWFKSLGL